MNFLAWIVALSALISVLIQSVAFHRATVCRQKAWLKSTELLTRTLLTEERPFEKDGDLSCKLYLVRRQAQVTWQLLPSLKRHSFTLDVQGKL